MFQTILRFADKPNWQVEVDESRERIIVCMKDQPAGEKWIEWRIGQIGDLTILAQTVFFARAACPGFYTGFSISISCHRLI